MTDNQGITPPHLRNLGNLTQPTNSIDSELEGVLDAHAEYYIRQTMKFFQENGESPALSKNNEGDLTAKQAIKALYISRKEIEEAIATLPESFNKGEVGYDEHREAFLAGWKYSQNQLRAKLLPPTKGGNDVSK